MRSTNGDKKELQLWPSYPGTRTSSFIEQFTSDPCMPVVKAPLTRYVIGDTRYIKSRQMEGRSARATPTPQNAMQKTETSEAGTPARSAVSMAEIES